MYVIPAIDLLNGDAVRLVERDPARQECLEPALDILQRYAAAGAPLVQLTDLSGLIGVGAENAAQVGEMARVVPLQVRLGRNDPASLERCYEMGVARIVVEWDDLERPELFARIPRRQVLVALDFRAGELVSLSGRRVSVDDAVRRIVDLGIERVCCCSVDLEGTMEGPDHTVLVRMASTGLAVVACGGVGSLDHLRELQQYEDVEAVVVGKALASRCFTYKEAMAVC